MKIISKLFAAIASLALAVSCVGNSTNSATLALESGVVKSEAKYIFYFIGDGMAATQVRLAEAALTAPEFVDNYAKLTGANEKISQLNIKSLNVTGLATSNAENRYITDSAAAGTALATGSKTNVGIISQSSDGKPLKTMAEMARDKGMKVGVVSSVSIDHATPACFYAHSESRNKYPFISDQIITSGFDYFAGGSPRWDKRASEEGTDKATAYASFKSKAEEAGFKFATTRAEFDAVGRGGEVTPIIATLDMLANEQNTTDGSAMPYTIDLASYSDDNKISLAQFTQKGIDLLDNKKGFFMMVEGGKIDWACHANDAATVTYEVVAFDEAIGVAMEFAVKHPRETLIVVTGDHDCGGLTIGFAGTGYDSAFDVLAKSRNSYFSFTAKVHEKISQGAKFEELLVLACAEFGFTDDVKDGSDGVITTTSELSDYEVSILREAYKKSAKKSEFNDTDKYRKSYSGYDPFTTTCTHILNNKAGVDFTSYSHTGVPVMVFAHGINEELFSGYYDNTDIAKRIMLAGGLK
ncbi:MAG: alkaline phosphatase [Rikenellaceae bacterium]